MSLHRRIKRLEGGLRAPYPEAIVREAMRRLTTGELESYDAMLRRVVEEGAPEEEAEPAVRHIVRLCEEVKRGTTGQTLSGLSKKAIRGMDFPKI